MTQFVANDFDIPMSLDGPGFRLEPLGVDHNERDHEAWMSSIDHIHSTPGFELSEWPRPMSLAENEADLARHSRDFAERSGFTYSVLDGDEVVGCVYVYPSPDHDATVRSWVRLDRADMDPLVWEAVSAWLADVWPFATVDYAPRGQR